MSNPFTRFLNQWSGNRPFDAFIERWDTLEYVMVAVYREKMTTAEAQPLYDQSWPWLRKQYPDWQAILKPYWEPTRAAGKPIETDPFQLLLDIPSPEAILGDWNAMQHLPAAREAVNRYLADQPA